ncbi:class I SAM-dependent methyltransferase [Oxalobacteraceae bacterium]|nr:class I SAM-dependent methyltransferase [Oxalobacteraceae bacterium]
MPRAPSRSNTRSPLARLLRAPAIQATLIQCVAFLPTLALTYTLATLRLPLNLFGVALLQGVLAALITWRMELASWWRPIQLLFPLALLGASALHLPPQWFLLAFLLLLGLYWSTFRTQVPYYPSNPAVWDAVRQLLPQGKQQGEPQGEPLRLIDIGSGLGGLTLYLARQRPDCVCTGIELAPLPWLYSYLRARLSGSGAHFIRGDYEALEFCHFDMVFAYLSPAAMEALWNKACAEMRPGSMLISYEFQIAARKADKTILTTAGRPPLYVWYF